jgi:hypothetical protein
LPKGDGSFNPFPALAETEKPDPKARLCEDGFVAPLIG